MDGEIELEARRSGPGHRSRPSYTERLSFDTTADMRRDAVAAMSTKPQAAFTARQQRMRVQLQRARLAVATRSVGVASRLIRPLKILRRPVVALQTAWRRSRTLPPTKAGRKIPIGLGSVDPAKLKDERTGKPYRSNVMSSGIYTFWDFLPRQLLYQFSKLANVYFLFVSILQMIPSWSTTGSYTTIIPLMIFVSVAMAREGFDDWCRHKTDREENSREVLVGASDGQGGVDWHTRTWKQVRVGDMVRVLQNEWIPADLVLLWSSGPKGQASVETLALDGETNLKSKEAVAELQEAFNVDKRGTTEALVTTEDPNLDLYNFEGSVQIGEGKVIPIGNGNILYRGSMARNTASVIGVVIFTGQESKVQLNATRGTRTKAPKLQTLVNKIVIVMAAFVLLLSGFSTLASGRIQSVKGKYWYLKGLYVGTTQNIMGFIIMFNTLIPLSLYVSMEICKLFQMWLMQSDVDMYDAANDVRCSVQTVSLNEELGQVSYIFSDKTGTLTDNIMLFRKLSIGGFPWLHDLDLYFTDDAEGADSDGASAYSDGSSVRENNSGGPNYLFHHARQRPPREILDLAEQLAALPRKSFGGRLSNANRLVGRPSMSRQSMSRPSRVSMSGGGHHAATPSKARPSTATVGSVTSAAREWTSTAVPSKPQLTPSTLELLDYIMTHPHTAYSQRTRFFLLALSLCHTASPEIDLSQEADGSRSIESLDYQASSPDELALVSAARDLGYLVVDRQQDSITIRTYPMGFGAPPRDEVYEILDTIEFTSTRKRMSLIVKFPDGRICLMCKGADNVMIERLRRSLLKVAHSKQNLIQRETVLRRSLEADLANATHNLNGESTSLDALLARSSQDAAIAESGRQSMQLRKRSIEARRSIERGAAAVQARRSQGSVFSGNPLSPVHTSPPVLQNQRQSLQLSQSPPQAHQQTSQRPQSPVQSPGVAHSPPESPLSPHDLAWRQSSLQSPVRAQSPVLGQQNPVNRPQSPPPTQSTSEPQSPSGHVSHIPQDLDLDDRTVLERTLEHIDEFSTEGLRTLLYGHRFLNLAEYTNWKKDYDEARASLVDRQARIDSVSARIETEFDVTGASGIEDKLQVGVPETIDKLRRANIRMWMLTGDKRETAINIGYSCRLIKDYSTVVILNREDDLTAKIMAAIEELECSEIAHCVVVVDGATLAKIEEDPILLSLFVDLGLRADSVIVCRASPSQKATIVQSVRRREPKKVMLAIGDGANDIAMIQAADLGIGIAGREGLQAARASDYSIGQFRFLIKLLFVHGRWNYVRTCKYILATFYKEFFFYMGQLVYQRNTMFTGTSIYESWSISMFNTLFTSLPVICIGVMDQDLSPTTLVAVPELYGLGQKNSAFGYTRFLGWIIMAMLQCLMVQFLAVEFYAKNYGVKDDTIYPLGVIVYTSVVFIVCIKCQFITMMHYITIISLLAALISMIGYLLWNILIGWIYMIKPDKTYFAEGEFIKLLGKEVTYWGTVWLCVVIAILAELGFQIFVKWVRPSETDDFQILEMQSPIMARLEAEAEMELHQGWEYQEQMDTSWTAFLHRKWPAEPRFKASNAGIRTNRRRKRDVLAEKLGLKTSQDYDREIQEILDMRARELDEQSSSS